MQYIRSCGTSLCWILLQLDWWSVKHFNDSSGFKRFLWCNLPGYHRPQFGLAILVYLLSGVRVNNTHSLDYRATVNRPEIETIYRDHDIMGGVIENCAGATRTPGAGLAAPRRHLCTRRYSGTHRWPMDVRRWPRGRTTYRLSLIHISEPTRPY